MEVKKTPKADLQNKRGLFLEIGLAVTLALIILLFRMSQSEVEMVEMDVDRAIVEQELVEVTFEEQKPPEVQQTVVQTTFEILDIVRDDKVIDASISFADVDFGADITFEAAVVTEEEISEGEIFMRVENMPLFQGQPGDVAFRSWVMSRLQFPAVAAEMGIQGRVMVEFVVERDGTLTGVNILSQPDRSLGEETIRVISTSPKWTPGSQRGVPVRVKYVIPIDFRLQ